MESGNYQHLVLSFLLLLVTNTSSAMMPDFFAEASSANQNRGATSMAPNEVIDTFSGGLSIVHTDLVVPGNGGMDIRIQRSYSSNNVYVKPVGGVGSQYQQYSETSPYGLGWSMHFGRVRMSASYFNDTLNGWSASKSCPPVSFQPETGDNPYLEMPDGSQRQLFCNDFPSTYSTSAHFITKDNWVVTPIQSPTQGTTGFLVIDSNGIKYTMNRRLLGGTVPNSQYVWYTTKIQDPNNNQINIEYENSSGRESPIYKRITASNNRTVTFNYSNKGTPRRRSYVQSATAIEPSTMRLKRLFHRTRYLAAEPIAYCSPLVSLVRLETPVSGLILTTQNLLALPAMTCLKPLPTHKGQAQLTITNTSA